MKFRSYDFIFILFFTQTFSLAGVQPAIELQPINTNDLDYTLSNPGNNEGIELLLSRLDLDGDHMKPVRSQSDNPQKAIEKLLGYYRQRQSVQHPTSRIQRSENTQMNISERDLEIADNAIRHIFIGQQAYPPHFCGDDINWNSRPVKDMEWVWQLNRMYFWDAYFGSIKYFRFNSKVVGDYSNYRIFNDLNI